MGIEFWKFEKPNIGGDGEVVPGHNRLSVAGNRRLQGERRAAEQYQHHWSSEVFEKQLKTLNQGKGSVVQSGGGNAPVPPRRVHWLGSDASTCEDSGNSMDEDDDSIDEDDDSMDEDDDYVNIGLQTIMSTDVTPVRPGAQLGPHGTELIDLTNIGYTPPMRSQTSATILVNREDSGMSNRQRPLKRRGTDRAIVY
jgi:hypothetical protein